MYLQLFNMIERHLRKLQAVVMDGVRHNLNDSHSTQEVGRDSLELWMNAELLLDVTRPHDSH